MHWHLQSFQELTNEALYAIMKARQEVFIIEQNCNYLDADGKDIHCLHLTLKIENQIAAYARIVPAGISYVEVSIGRVLTAKNFRRKNYGIELMHKAIAYATQLYGNVPIKIGAQQYLKAFYESFGFVQQGEPYLEDDIPHIYMLRQADIIN
jgi:ElaA protein